MSRSTGHATLDTFETRFVSEMFTKEVRARKKWERTMKGLNISPRKHETPRSASKREALLDTRRKLGMVTQRKRTQKRGDPWRWDQYGMGMDRTTIYRERVNFGRKHMMGKFLGHDGIECLPDFRNPKTLSQSAFKTMNDIFYVDDSPGTIGKGEEKRILMEEALRKVRGEKDTTAKSIQRELDLAGAIDEEEKKRDRLSSKEVAFGEEREGDGISHADLVMQQKRLDGLTL